MITEVILDEAAIAEIEARHEKADSIVDEFYATEFALSASLNDIPALCATVRALMAKNEKLQSDVARFSTLADERHDQIWEARRQRDNLAANCAPYLQILE